MNLNTITTTSADIYAIVSNTLRSYEVHCKGASKRISTRPRDMYAMYALM